MNDENYYGSLKSIHAPLYKEYFLTENDFELFKEEIEIKEAIIKFNNEKFKNIYNYLFNILMQSIIYFCISLASLALPFYFLSYYFNLSNLSIIGQFIIYIFGFFCVMYGVMYIIYFIGFGYFEIKNSSLLKNKKYVNYYKYKKAYSEYLYSKRLNEKNYWLSLSGRSFEIELANLFSSKGFVVSITKQGGDGGIDLVLRNKDNNYVIGVQCKAHNSKISPHVARDLLGTINSFKFNKGYLITLEGGTLGTIEFCKKNNITIWDVNDIVSFKTDDNFNIDKFIQLN